MRGHRLKEILLGGFSGLLMYLSFSKYNFFFLGFPALFLAIRPSPLRFFSFGLIFFGLSLKWLAIPLVKYGGIEPVWGYTSLLLLILFLVFYQFGFTYILWKIVGYRYELFPFIYTVVEILRSFFPYGGFPWLLIGGLLVDIPVLRFSLPLGTVYGSTFILLLLILFPFFKSSVKKIVAGITLSIFLGGILWELKPLNHPKGIKVGIIQTAIPEDIKLNPYLFEKMYPLIEKQINEALSKGADLILLPESAVPFFLHQLEKRGLNILKASFKSHIIMGIIDVSGEKPFNTVVHIHKGKVVGVYKKTILVPFGEYTPYPFKFFSDMIPYLGLTDYAKGEGPTCFKIDNFTLGTPICFEVAYFPYVRKFPCEVIAVLTNDAWFEDSDGTYQHMKFARIRALEEGKYVLWVNNTGPSGVISPKGEVIKAIEYGRREVLLFTL